MKTRQKIRDILALQSAFLLFAFAMSLSKAAGNALKAEGLFSFSFLSLIAGIFALLALYALFWQKLLARIPLSVAYLNKAFSLLWTLLFAHLFFGEKISVSNILGLLMIMFGVILVNLSSVRSAKAPSECAKAAAEASGSHENPAETSDRHEGTAESEDLL